VNRLTRQRGFCARDGRALRRGRNCDNWSGFPPFAGFSAVQDDADIFRHPRPAGLDAVLPQQIRNGRTGHLLLAQLRDGVVDGLQMKERNAAWLGLERLNRFPQSREIGRCFIGGAHHFGRSWLEYENARGRMATPVW